jgi:uncharacterized protein YukE
MPEVRYPFAEMGDGTACLNNNASGIGAEKDNWAREVGLVGESWRDQANGMFNELNAVWDTAANSTNDFLIALAAGLAQAQANGENGLAQCMRVLS